MHNLVVLIPLLLTQLAPAGADNFDSGHPVETVHNAAEPVPLPTIPVPGEAAYDLEDVPVSVALEDEESLVATGSPPRLLGRRAAKKSSTTKKKTTKRKTTKKRTSMKKTTAKPRSIIKAAVKKPKNTAKTTTKRKVTTTKKKTTPVKAAVRKTTTMKKKTTVKKTTTTKKRLVKIHSSASVSAFAITPSSTSNKATVVVPISKTTTSSIKTTTTTTQASTSRSTTTSSSSSRIVSTSTRTTSSTTTSASSSSATTSVNSRTNTSSSASSTSTSTSTTSTSASVTASSPLQSSSYASSSTSTLPSSASSTPADTPSSPAGKRKRGLAYNKAAWTQPFGRNADPGSQVSWTYNWWQQSGGDDYNTALEYIPMLWSNSSDLTSSWLVNAQAAIDNGTTALMAFNEPDLCHEGSGASCMTVASAVKAWKKYMQPFAGKAKLGLPAVTNGGAPYGLTWLKKFIAACDGCTFDFVNLHWYSNVYAGAAYFESYVNSARDVANGMPIWVTEYGLTDDYTQAQLNAFMQTTMAWMDAQPDIARYSYFMTTSGFPYLINNAGNGMSVTGSLYNTYVNSSKQANLY